MIACEHCGSTSSLVAFLAAELGIADPVCCETEGERAGLFSETGGPE